MHHVARLLTLPPAQISARTQILEDVAQTIVGRTRTDLPPLSLHPFGSFVLGMGLPDSDVDCTVCMQGDGGGEGGGGGKGGSGVGGEGGDKSGGGRMSEDGTGGGDRSGGWLKKGNVDIQKGDGSAEESCRRKERRAADGQYTSEESIEGGESGKLNNVGKRDHKGKGDEPGVKETTAELLLKEITAALHASSKFTE